MMDASIDTNIIIHLYEANFQSILFNRFHKLYVYEFIRNHEMENHAILEIKNEFDKDVDSGKIELITDSYLRKIGMYEVFQYHVKEYRLLFEGGDLGEVYAIAIALTLGCMCLVTDDIKERGPHYTLMRIPDSEIMPLAFYEIMFIDYLEDKMTEQDLFEHFSLISTSSKLNMNCLSKLKGFIRRFWNSPYNEKEKEWMINFCRERNIQTKAKLQKLTSFIQKQNI